MFPGQGRHTYQGNYGPPQGPPPNQQYNNYGPPQNPPPQQYNNYERPNQPPPQQQYNNYNNKQQPGLNGEPNYGDQYGSGHYSRPPQSQQSFGVQNYNYQYSQCNGKKKALLVGINYYGTSNELRGCINDVTRMEQFLVTHGFSENDIVKLSDDQRNQRAIPLRQNILDAIHWLVKDARPNDSLFFHYSGHGGQTRDLDGDEADGYDEVIYPLDFETNGFIVDDLLHDTLVKSLPPGCRLTALFDSCHSGSALDLPYMYSTKGVLKEPNVYAETGQDLLKAGMGYLTGNNRNMMSGLSSAFKSVMNQGKASKAEQVSKQTKTAPCDAISFSGCKDDQTSADASEQGQATGAMSYAFLAVMNQNPNQSYLSLLQNMRTILQNKYSQKPQLTASHPIDTNLQFIF
ncbi:casA [Candida jiufengensis]|uniref:casA n=1 Tax=Candida jiufengensis TaxID=497108 RepID=UPI002224402C|nr:casA [Candida jiufengensis]KAI5952568.1 casA [Candida jiufengensis]